MSEVEETIERIKVQAGVEGYVICNKAGLVLRRFPSMPQDVADMYAESMRTLATKACHVVRELDPRNELQYLRIRAKKHEVLVAYDSEFLVIIIQRWQPAGSS